MTVRLQFVGCGDAFGSGGRFNTCFHVTGARANFLIDCGASSLIALKRLGIDRNAIDTIIFTHFHGDHFGGIPYFMLDAQFFARRAQPLTLVGPAGLEDWYGRVMETSFPGSSATRQRFDLHFRPIEAGETAAVNGIDISAYQALHGNPDGPFLAVRVGVEGRTIAYTGDSAWTDGLAAAGRGADLLIAEAYFRDKAVPLHLDLATLEAHLPAIEPRRVVLTHMSDDMLAQRDKVPYEAAEDGMVVEV